MHTTCLFWMRFCKIHRAPSSRRLLFWHLDSPLGQLHPHPASENGEKQARNEYALSMFWAHHPQKAIKTALKYCACFSASALSLPSSVGAVVAAAFQIFQNLVRGTVQARMSFRLVLPSATLCTSMPSQVLPFFRMVFRMYCDILLYC